MIDEALNRPLYYIVSPKLKQAAPTYLV